MPKTRKERHRVPAALTSAHRSARLHSPSRALAPVLAPSGSFLPSAPQVHSSPVSKSKKRRLKQLRVSRSESATMPDEDEGEAPDSGINALAALAASTDDHKQKKLRPNGFPTTTDAADLPPIRSKSRSKSPVKVPDIDDHPAAPSSPAPDEPGVDGARRARLTHEASELRRQIAELESQLVCKNTELQHVSNERKTERQELADSRAKTAALESAQEGMNRAVENQGKVIMDLQQNAEQIRDLLSCGVCFEGLADPHVLSCGHSACKKCLLQWFRSSNAYRGPDITDVRPEDDLTFRTKLCHLCREPVYSRPVRMFVLQSVLETVGLAEAAEVAAADPGLDPQLNNSTDDPWHLTFPPTQAAYVFKDGLDRTDRCPACGFEVADGECFHCGAAFSVQGEPGDYLSGSGDEHLEHNLEGSDSDGGAWAPSDDDNEDNLGESDRDIFRRIRRIIRNDDNDNGNRGNNWDADLPRPPSHLRSLWGMIDDLADESDGEASDVEDPDGSPPTPWSSRWHYDPADDELHDEDPDTYQFNSPPAVRSAPRPRVRWDDEEGERNAGPRRAHDGSSPEPRMPGAMWSDGNDDAHDRAPRRDHGAFEFLLPGQRRGNGMADVIERAARRHRQRMEEAAREAEEEEDGYESSFIDDDQGGGSDSEAEIDNNMDDDGSNSDDGSDSESDSGSGKSDGDSPDADAAGAADSGDEADEPTLEDLRARRAARYAATRNESPEGDESPEGATLDEVPVRRRAVGGTQRRGRIILDSDSE